MIAYTRTFTSLAQQHRGPSMAVFRSGVSIFYCSLYAKSHVARADVTPYSDSS